MAMAAEQKPNFIARGVRRFAEVTLWPAAGVGALGLFVTQLGFLAAPGFGIAIADGVALGMIRKPRGAN